MVHDVEQVRAEREANAFCDAEILRETGIEIDQTRPIKRIARGVAHNAGISRCEAGRVEQIEPIAFIDLKRAAADIVRPVIKLIEAAVIEVCVGEDGERLAGIQIGDSGKSPSGNSRVEKTMRIAQERAAMAEGQFISKRVDETLLDAG